MRTVAFAIVVGLIVILFLIRPLVSALRSEYLRAKYGPEILSRIVKGEIWEGMTSDMLLASRGQPSVTQNRVYRGKCRQTWKFGKLGSRRHSLAVHLEDGRVIGWRS